MPELIVRRATADDASNVAHLFATLGYPIQPDDVPSRLARLEVITDAVLLAMDDTGGARAGSSGARVADGAGLRADDGDQCRAPGRRSRLLPRGGHALHGPPIRHHLVAGAVAESGAAVIPNGAVTSESPRLRVRSTGGS
ncbi:MAG: hypothetical protein ACR2HZ_10405 [Gemmatimonadaceae bacterium]